MSRSITILPAGSDPAPADLAGQIAGRATTSHGMSAVQVAPVDKANATQVEQPQTGKPDKGVPADIPVRGGMINTTAGPAPIRTTMTGDTFVNIGGLEMSLAQAKHHGLITGDEPITPTATDAPAPADAPKGDDLRALDNTIEGSAVVESEHIAVMGQAEAAFTGAGIDPEQALSDIVTALATDGTFEGAAAEALNAKYGEDAVQTMLNQGEAYWQHAVGAAMKSEMTPEQMTGLTQDKMDAFYTSALGTNPAIVVAAMKGNLTPLRAAMRSHFNGRT